MQMIAMWATPVLTVLGMAVAIGMGINRLRHVETTMREIRTELRDEMREMRAEMREMRTEMRDDRRTMEASIANTRERVVALEAKA